MQLSICNANAFVKKYETASNSNMLYKTHMQTDHPNAEEDITRKWVENLVAQEGTTPSQVAERRGIAPSTLTRFMNHQTKSLSIAVLTKLAANSPVAIPLLIQKNLTFPLNLGENRV